MTTPQSQGKIPEATEDDLKLDLEQEYSQLSEDYEPYAFEMKLIRLAAHYKRALEFVRSLNKAGSMLLGDKNKALKTLTVERDRYKAEAERLDAVVAVVVPGSRANHERIKSLESALRQHHEVDNVEEWGEECSLSKCRALTQTEAPDAEGQAAEASAEAFTEDHDPRELG